MRDGVWLTTPARTWLDCSALIPLPHLVAMGDSALRGNQASRAELDRLIRWAWGRRGVVSARRAVELLDPASESPGESLARIALVMGGVPAPVCNASVYDDGEWIARVDMLWPDERVVVEYDGIVHLPESQRRHDAVRRNLLQQAGHLVIVFTARDLAHPTDMCALVSSALRTRRL